MLNISYYSGAVIRLATLQSRRGQAGRLLFATVSLLPRDRPFPSYMEESPHRCAVGKTGQSVFFRRTLVTVQDAIDWYRGLGNGKDTTPIPSKVEERDDRFDGVDIATTSLHDSPAWPQLGLPMVEGSFAFYSGRSHPAPFIGNSPSRIHRRLGSQDGFDVMLADDEVVAFVARRLHINLRLYREYLGSVVLVAPDPVLRQIDHFMIPATEGVGERIFYRFVPRSGASLAGLKLTTFDEQSHLLTDVSSYDIPSDGILDIDKGDCIGCYGYVITHSEHGVLAYSPPTSFLRQISFNAQAVSSGGMKVSVPISESANSSRIEYQAAQRSSLFTQNLIGESSRIPSVNGRITTAVAYREKIASAKQYGQRWFPNGSRVEAMRFIQGELRRAKSRIMIADPYLSGLQLGQFLYAANPETTVVTLLTSNLAFKTSGDKSSKIADFSSQLAQLEKDIKVIANSYVLHSAALHDRFLVVDDAVWFLGNSLNTLGEKASLIVKVPNPDEVIAHIEDMLKQATPFDDYRKREATHLAEDSQ